MTTSLASLIGDSLLSASGAVNTNDINPKVTGLYFSAHWCPPCRGFTPTLAKTYKEMKANKKDFEIIFISSDKTQESFDEYFAEMPWLALPFEDRERKASLSKKYKVSGIPALILLDEDGKILDKDGRSVVTDDPKGEEFPWTKKPLAELLGTSFINSEGTVTKEAFEGKVLGIYFSAHWCPPCRAFTPDLISTYNTLKDQGKPFEIIFASSDRSQGDFEEYFDEMPWLAIPYEDRARKSALSSHFGVQGIPTLVMVDADGTVINTSGRGSVSGDPEGLEFPWRPKPVNDLKTSTDGLNDETCVIVLMEGSDAATQSQVEGDMRTLAEEHTAQRKATDGEQGNLFFTAKSTCGIVDRIRELCGLDSGKKEEPSLLILDAQDEGAFYVYEGDKPIDGESIREFVTAYENKTLRRQQIS